MRGLSILLVDDDPSHRMLARRAILAFCPGAHIVEADSIPSAAGLIKDQRTFALIILDLRLGEGTAQTLLSAIRAEHPPESLPVMILSTSTLETDVYSCYRAGANAYIVKSCDPGEFSDNLKGALRFFLGTA